MATMSNYVMNLPQELIDNIFYRLSLRDISNWIGAHDIKPLGKSRFDIQSRLYKLENLTQSRRQPLVYLGDTFPNPAELLKCMFMNSVLISGSYASGFFDPDSTLDSSDIDFYALPTIRGIYNFMEYMKTIGTTWYTAIDILREKLSSDSSEESISVTTYVHLCILYNRELIPADMLQSVQSLIRDDMHITNVDSARDFIARYRRGSWPFSDDDMLIDNVQMPNNKTKAFIITKNEYLQYSIIQGTLYAKGKTTKIQLMINSQHRIDTYLPMDSIIKFDGTITQCAITGFATFHMYSNELYSRQITRWDTRSQFTGGVNETNKYFKKYEERGYKFFDSTLLSRTNYVHSESKIKRILGDPNSEVLTYTGLDYMEGSHYYRLTSRIKWLYNYTWLERSRYIELDPYSYSSVPLYSLDGMIDITPDNSTHKEINIVSQIVAHIQQDVQALSTMYNPIKPKRSFFDLYLYNTSILL